MVLKKDFPAGMQPLGKKSFNFKCYEGVDCFMVCCRNVDMFLYPYDIIRLKTFLNISSQKFLENFTRVLQGAAHPYFPSVMLRLTDDEIKSCPFLENNGCAVYTERPSACRTYPLERGVDRSPGKHNNDFYFLTDHEYCHGHKENKSLTVQQWIRDQRLDSYNNMNDHWAELDTLFSTNPWKGEGSSGPKQQIAFTACYDIDNFRLMVNKHNILERLTVSRDQKKRINSSDSELLKFAFEWVKNFLGAPSSLLSK